MFEEIITYLGITVLAVDVGIILAITKFKLL
jgi:hypothetical protein